MDARVAGVYDMRWGMDARVAGVVDLARGDGRPRCGRC